MTPKCPDCNHDQDDCICIDSFSVGAASRDSEVANLKQQVSHMVDMVACEKSDAGLFKRQRDELLNYVESEYAELADVRNNWHGRHTLEGQAKLCRLRDLICEITWRDAEDVQDDFSNRLAVIVLKENTK